MKKLLALVLVLSLILIVLACDKAEQKKPAQEEPEVTTTQPDCSAIMMADSTELDSVNSVPPDCTVNQ